MRALDRDLRRLSYLSSWLNGKFNPETEEHQMKHPSWLALRHALLRRDQKFRRLASRLAGILALCLLLPVTTQADETLGMSREALRIMAESGVIGFSAVGGPAGPLHKPENDCEFHFVIETADGKWKGDLAAWIAELPNVCLYDRTGTTGLSFSALKAHWKKWAGGLKGEGLTVEGIPRIWFEHTHGGGGPGHPRACV